MVPIFEDKKRVNEFFIYTFLGSKSETNIPGLELDLYGRLVKLSNCDQFTRSFLASEGVELAPVDPVPVHQVKLFFSIKPQLV